MKMPKIWISESFNHKIIIRTFTIITIAASLFTSTACGTEASSVISNKNEVFVSDIKDTESEDNESEVSETTESVINDNNTTDDSGYPELKSSYDSLPEGIVCWGDSLTFGYGGDGVTYPGTLENLLREDGLDIPVENMGASGEDSITIAGRSGGIRYVLSADTTIPAECVGTEVHLVSEDGKQVFPSIIDDVGINECVIGGVRGVLTKWVPLSNDGDYTFVRAEAGNEVHVKSGMPVTTYAMEHFKDYISIVFVGTNGGFDSFEELVKQQDAIVNSRDKDTDRFLIIGILDTNNIDNEEYETYMKETYGERFLDARKYFVTDALNDAGITPTYEDQSCIENGVVPESLRVDGQHLTAKGYELLGNLVYKRLKELNYFTVN